MTGTLEPVPRGRRLGRPPGPWAALLALPVVALVIPASLVLSGPLRSNGWPARLMIFWIAAMVLLGWVTRWASRSPGPPGGRAAPAEVGTWLLIFGLCTSLGGALIRDLTPVEAAGAVRFALVLLPLAVLALGISTLADSRRSDLLLAGLLTGAAIGAVIAIAQFVVPFDWDQVLRLPPLQTGDPTGTGSRGGFTRIRGATDHPIELGVISGAAAPLGIHFARFAGSRRARVLATLGTLVLLISIPLSVSRSGVLVAALAIAVYGIALDGRQRLTALVLGLAGVMIFRAAIPGLLGTVLAIFRAASGDDSITGRTEDYAIVHQLWREQPLLGYGLGTFRPEEYFFLDNQYLMALVEGGVPLLAVQILFFVLALSSTRGAVRRATTGAESSRAHAVGAALLAIGVSGTFFDLFSFAQVTVVTFVLVGVSGAVWRHAVCCGRPLPEPAKRFLSALSGQR